MTTWGLPGLLSRTPLLRRLEDRPAALRGAAEAGVEPLVLLGVLRVALVLVVVQDLRPRLDVLLRVDEDPVVLDDRLGVRVAGVVDEPRDVPAPPPVDHRVLVEGEEEGVVAPHVPLDVAALTLVGGHALAGVFDDALAPADAARREHAAPLDLRPADFDGKRAVVAGHGDGVRSGSWSARRARGRRN